MKCKKCGAENALNKKTCKRCGKDLSLEKEEMLYYDFVENKNVALVYYSGGIFYNAKRKQCTITGKAFAPLSVGDVLVLGHEKYKIEAMYNNKNETCQHVNAMEICAVCFEKVINQRFIEGLVEKCPNQKVKYTIFRLNK